MVHSLYGYDNVGFHLGQEATTLDFNGELSGEQILDLERRANQAVYEDIPVQVLYPDSEELKKLDYRSKIEIEGQVRLVSVPATTSAPAARPMCSGPERSASSRCKAVNATGADAG